MKKFAYVTLVARDKYIDGAICLYKSLKDKSKYPLIAMTYDVSDRGMDMLRSLGIHCWPVEKIESVKAGIGDNTARLMIFAIPTPNFTCLATMSLKR